MARDHYLLHRAALAPLLPGASGRELEQAINRALAFGEMPFAHFLCAQGLAPLWDERLEHHAQAARLSQQFRSALHHERLQVTGDYLLHRHNLAKIKELLDTAGIAHVVTKGSHTRELYYDTPALRPAVDIDVLIEPENKISAIKVFQSQGFIFEGKIDNIAQDCSMIKGKTSIDLHWDILRPGRTRRPMVKQLVATRVDYGSHWGMSHGATLFLMLVHPVFRKYTTTPHASLVRLVDLLQLLYRQPESIGEALPLLDMAGLSTAGWITSAWLYLLTGDPKAESLVTALKPGKLRRIYLNNWLAENRSTTLLGKPLLIQLGFTLPAHDSLSDVTRAVRQARLCKRDAGATLAAMQKQIL